MSKNQKKIIALAISIGLLYAGAAILFIVTVILKDFIFAIIGIIVVLCSIIPVKIYEDGKKKARKEKIRARIPSDRFIPVNFRKRNDIVVDEILKSARAFEKMSNDDENTVILKIEITENEIYLEMPIEYLNT